MSPNVEIHATADFGGARVTLLAYELKNVLIVGYGLGDRLALKSEEIKVTYFDYDRYTGQLKGTIERELKGK